MPTQPIQIKAIRRKGQNSTGLYLDCNLGASANKSFSTTIIYTQVSNKK